jgi:hypothetical protein
MPGHTNQHYISARPFLGGFLFNCRLPFLSPRSSQGQALLPCHDTSMSNFEMVRGEADPNNSKPPDSGWSGYVAVGALTLSSRL